MRYLLTLIFCLVTGVAYAAPTLNFSDITSGPKTGNTDGEGSGAIVSVWGNNLGSTQGASKVYVGNVEATKVYYWKDADGQLPGGPSDLKTYHKMQEVAFAVPATAVDGVNTISVTVSGVDSNTLPFTVRAGNIRYVKSGGANSGAGTWTSPWATLQYVASGAGGVLTAGDIVYTHGIGASGSGSTSAMVLAGPLTGTESNPISVIAYPNTRPELTGAATTANGYTVYNTGANPSGYWNWSKLKVTTTGSAFNPIKSARFVGLEITGPTVYAGFSGAIGGSNTEHAGGIKIYGAYIHHYGVDNGVATAGHTGTGTEDYPAGLGTTWDKFQHLFYLSARTNEADPGGIKPIAGYEIAWGHFTDNPIYQGIHIYDMSESVGWTSPIYIHHNVVKNQRGNAINVDLPHLITTPIYIHDNLCISDSNDVYGVAAIHIELRTAGASATVYNNTFYGYNATNAISGGTIDYRNNIMVDTKGIPYHQYAPNLHSNNLFYSTGATAQPSWATAEAGHITGNPLFVNAATYDFSLQAGSSALNAGYNTTATAPIDFLGNTRTSTPDIGAFGAGTGGTPINGACGSSNGGTFSSAPTTNLCTTGTTGTVTGTGPWSWTCTADTVANCSASYQAPQGPSARLWAVVKAIFR